MLTLRTLSRIVGLRRKRLFSSSCAIRLAVTHVSRSCAADLSLFALFCAGEEFRDGHCREVSFVEQGLGRFMW